MLFKLSLKQEKQRSHFNVAIHMIYHRSGNFHKMIFIASANHTSHSLLKVVDQDEIFLAWTIHYLGYYRT